MNGDTMLEELACRARQEKPPEFDVASAVLARIHSDTPQRLDIMAVLAGASAAAAAIVLAYALQTWTALQDPFSSMLVSLNPVLQ